ncbi:MAG TPA: phosphatase PAP2 family protein [Intrasporangium sp.]|nr:phosphatase PAP2 family protein [Intrasporangium sp.]
MTATSRWSQARPTRRELLVWSAGSATLAAGALVLGVLTKPGQIADAELASLIHETIPADGRRLLNDLARPLLPYLLAPLAALLFLRGLVRRQWRRCLGTAAALPAIPLSIWLRDEMVPRPQLGVPGYDWNTFPSTHATVGFVVLTAVVLLWPWRPGRLGAGLAAAVGLVIAVGNVAWYAHRPVDVLGSLGIVIAPVFLTLGLTLGVTLGVVARPTRGSRVENVTNDVT